MSMFTFDQSVMEQIERNGTFISAFICECGRPIRTANRTCGCCFDEGYVTLHGTCDRSTNEYCWEIFMGGITEEPIAVLKCVYCMRAIVSKDRRCECGLYCRLELKQQEVPATSFAPTSYRWELHRFGTSEDVPDRLDVRVVETEINIEAEIDIELEVDSQLEPSESPIIELLTRRERERAALRKEATELRKQNSYRKTAKILGISLGKLQYLLQEGEPENS